MYRKGKRMRPLFVFLTALMVGEVRDSTYTAASMIELLHTATLVHDDIVDDANERRGYFSINSLWKNKIAVLIGDFLLSRGMLLALEKNEVELLRIVSDAVKQMSEGELLQIEKARRLDIEEDIYFEIIKKKTASLIASCCACGALSAGGGPEEVNKMRDFGEKIGVAFQIKDDLFDFNLNNRTGKPSGIDIKEKKLTLPLIYLLNNSPKSEKRKIIHTIRNHSTDSSRVNEIINKVNSSGGIEYAKSKMQDFTNEALELLKSYQESEARNSLEQLVIYTIERKK